MPSVRPFGRPAPIRADVHALPTATDTAEASSDLWAVLSRKRPGANTTGSVVSPEGRLAVAIEWAPERRLPPSSSRSPRKLVVWVRKAAAEVSGQGNSRPRRPIPEVR
jgi:hypothetical protein